MCARRADELRDCPIACDLAEMTLSFEHACGCPSQDHPAPLPALDPARDLADAAEQIFEQIGRGQRTLQALRQGTASR